MKAGKKLSASSFASKTGLALLTACILNVSPLFIANVYAQEKPDLAAIKADPQLSALVPEAYKNKSTLTVAVNPEVPPIKFVNDDGDIDGFTPDLVAAAAKVLGLKVNFTQTSFDSLIPGLSANRFDVLLSLGDFDSRHKQVTFVDYLNIGQTIVASPQRKLVMDSLDALCGLNVALPRGTNTFEDAKVLNEKCVKDGKKPVVISTYPDTNAVMLSIVNKSSDAVWVDSPAGSYNAKKFPDLYQTVFFYVNASYGIGFGTSEDGKKLASAMQQALLKLNKEGVYEQLLKKWGLPVDEGRPDFPINSPWVMPTKAADEVKAKA